ncbi:hypothetical protein JHK87_055206 [Glycine soja]|nr:hypothetical protein JHK87_055206 [Glycine soja]
MGELSEDGPDDWEGLDTSAAHIANLLSSEPCQLMGILLDGRQIVVKRLSQFFGPCFHSSIITYSLQEDVLLHTASGTPNYVAPEENLVTERKEKLVSMNAFELISRSQSFNHENLFEKQIKIRILSSC